MSTRRNRRLWLTAMALAAGMALPSAAISGQVTIDGTLRPAQSLSGPYYNITPSLGAVHGTNLFHSFGLFSLTQGDTANFTSSGMTNIIARVTGGSASSIDGTLQAMQPGVNLYLINPRGITFGPHAALSVAGSFYANTANYLRLADGGRFDASNPPASVLTTAAPSAFGFLGPTVAPIAAHGAVLRVADGKTLGLAGGDIVLSNAATVAAPGGRINLVSVASAGEAAIGAPAFEPGAFERLGALSITGASSVDASEAAGHTTGGGTIYIRGGSLTADGSFLLAKTVTGNSGVGADIALSGDLRLNNSRLDTASRGEGHAGDISINASGTVMLANSVIQGGAYENGDGGNIRISAGGLVLNGDSLIDSSGGSSPFHGRGGNITVTAPGEIRFDNSGLDAGAYGDGDGGTIAITAGGITMSNEAYIDNSSSAPGIGRGGDISIAASGSISMNGESYISSEARGPGHAGNIRIRTGDLTLRGGAYITSSGSEFPYRGRGGNITVVATGDVRLDNAHIEAGAYGHGDAGVINLSSRDLILSSEAYIENSGSEPPGVGRGGSVVITVARDIAMDRDAYVSTQSFGPGRGGDLEIVAGGTLGMDASSIQSGAWENGNGGNLRIRAANIALRNGASIDSSGSNAPFHGRGGDVAISAAGAVLLDASIISSRAFGQGDAGSISIRGNNFTASNRSYVLSSGSGAPYEGRGGNIAVDVSGLEMDYSYVQAQAVGAGSAGSITITADAMSLRGGAQVSGSTLASATGAGGDVRVIARRLSFSGTDPAGFSSGVFTNSGGMASGGQIFVSADEITLDARAAISAGAFGAGRGGSIAISAGSDIAVSGRALITAGSFGTGAAGAISVNAGSRLVLDGGSIQTSTVRSDGGDIRITARDLVHLRRGIISSSVQGGAGNGGNIFIDPTFVVLSDASRIIANAYGGDGGNIRIQAGHLFRSPDSVISASSQLGISGSVVITSPIGDIFGSLEVLPTTYLDASRLLAQHCAARVAGKAGSFIVAGRGGIPVEPHNWLAGAGAGDLPEPALAVVPVSPIPTTPLLAFVGAQGCRP